MSVSLDTRRPSPQEKAGPAPPRTAGGPGSRSVALWATGIMIAGGVGGLLLNSSFATGGRHRISARGTTLVASASATAAGDEDASSPEEAPARAPRPAFRAVQISSPDDPFRIPAGLVLEAAGKPAVTPGGGGPAPAAPKALGSVKPAVPARPAAPAGPAAPRLDEINLTGIIQGDPAVAVVKYGGQSLFLKIGDQVADTWRLVEIKDRSVMFQLGEQRVEITIQGGNSQ